MPLTLEAPGRLSTTICCPICRERSGASRRAVMSGALPAAIGTMKRMGRDGYASELARPATTASTTAISKRAGFATGGSIRVESGSIGRLLPCLGAYAVNSVLLSWRPWRLGGEASFLKERLMRIVLIGVSHWHTPFYSEP